MKLTLKRRFFAETYTIGSLYVDGVYLCDTLEDTNRDLNKDGSFSGKEHKVPHQTAIPFGTYEVSVSYSPHFKRKLPRLLNVPSFEGILIHRGNTTDDTSGCILVGENKVKGELRNSTYYETMLTDMITIEQQKGNKTTIEIL